MLKKWEKLLHCKSFSHFFNTKYWIISDIDIWKFNEMLTNDVVSFEQPGALIFKNFTKFWWFAQLWSNETDRWFIVLTHYYLETLKRVIGKCRPDQMPLIVATDQGQNCLLTGFSIKNRIKVTNSPNSPKMTNGLIQHITVEEFTVYNGLNTYYLC